MSRLTGPTGHADPHLAALVAFVRREANPSRVVLFGSRASDTARDDSDYDLLVVVDEGTDARALLRRLYARKRGLPVSADFLVASEAHLARHVQTPGLVYEAALRSGRVVYERGDA